MEDMNWFAGHKIAQLQWTLLRWAHSRILVGFGTWLWPRIPKLLFSPSILIGLLLLVRTIQTPSISIASGTGGGGCATVEEWDMWPPRLALNETKVPERSATLGALRKVVHCHHSNYSYHFRPALLRHKARSPIKYVSYILDNLRDGGLPRLVPIQLGDGVR